jgi:PKD repeat protein
LRYYQTDIRTFVGPFEWIIDNSNTELTDQTINYTLNEVGVYHITLNEYESDGAFSTVIKQVIVKDVHVKANFVAHSNHDYAIFKTFQRCTDKMKWDFGDGQTETYQPSSVFHDYDRKED